MCGFLPLTKYYQIEKYEQPAFLQLSILFYFICNQITSLTSLIFDKINVNWVRSWVVDSFSAYKFN